MLCISVSTYKMNPRELQERFQFSTEKTYIPASLEQLREAVLALREQGTYLGTHSWRFINWKGSFYLEKYERDFDFYSRSLVEYQKNLSTVVIDQSELPSTTSDFFHKLSMQITESFLPIFKMPYDLVHEEFPLQSLYGTKAGRKSDSFLDTNKAKKFIDLIFSLGLKHSIFAFFISEDDWKLHLEAFTNFFVELSNEIPIAVSVPFTQSHFPSRMIECVERKRVTPIFQFTRFMKDDIYPFNGSEVMISSQFDPKSELLCLFKEGSQQPLFKENLLKFEKKFILLENHSDFIAPDLISRLSKILN